MGAVSKKQLSSARSWTNVVVAALLMLATLPGRTQGLGLITEPMLEDLRLDRVLYANINLWATLLGAAFCFPAGWALDRIGIRWVSIAIVAMLGAVVWVMSGHTGGVLTLFLLIALTRALGQSALSVASITAVAKTFGKRIRVAMSVYSVLITIFFVCAFIHVGAQVTGFGWRFAWREIAMALLVGVAPVTLLLLSNARVAEDEMEREDTSGVTLHTALRTRAFWIFAGAAALYGLVASGLGLFNQAVLAERGFDQTTYQLMLAATTGISLLGQFACGVGTVRLPIQRLLGIAMVLYGISLAALPFTTTRSQLWIVATLAGISGGMITVIFFAVWRQVFGSAHVGRIQGAAQMLTVLASAVGPLIFAKTARMWGSYSPILLTLAAVVFVFAIAAWRTKVNVAGEAEVKTDAL